MKVEYVTHMGDDLMVANVARVSMDRYHKELEPSDSKLIKYLAEHKHFSPFAHPKIQLRTTMPIFIARQWEKHRVGTVRGYDLYDQNEVSRRYVDALPVFFSPETWRERPTGSVKQGSGIALENQGELTDAYNQFLDYASDFYNLFLSLNVAPEQARMVLPQSMYTMWIETGSLLYWARLVNLRKDTHAQVEIQTLASQINDIIEPLFPITWPYLMSNEL